MFMNHTWLNRSRQSLHWYGFSPLSGMKEIWIAPNKIFFGDPNLWILKCFVSVDESENAFLHALHRYGRSPLLSTKLNFKSIDLVACSATHLWVLMWVVTDELWEKRRSQMGHRNGFWPVWVRTCAVRLAACEKLFLQSGQRYGRSPVRCFFNEKCVFPALQINFLSKITWMRP